jgi:hypothetical protein
MASGPSCYAGDSGGTVQGRSPYPRYSWALLLVVAVAGCRSKGSERATTTPAPSASAVQQGVRRTWPNCYEVQACLRALSPSYDPERADEIGNAVYGCFGVTAHQLDSVKRRCPMANDPNVQWHLANHFGIQISEQLDGWNSGHLNAVLQLENGTITGIV